MKKILFLLTLATLQSCLSVRVHTTDDTLNYFKNVSNPNVYATGTYLDFEQQNEQWSNQNTSYSTSAKFSHSTGNSSVLLHVNRITKVDFHHEIELKGRMKFEVINPQNEIVYTKDFTQLTHDNFSLNLKKGKYVVKWTAQNASGRYALEWRETNP